MNLIRATYLSLLVTALLWGGACSGGDGDSGVGPDASPVGDVDAGTPDPDDGDNGDGDGENGDGDGDNGNGDGDNGDGDGDNGNGDGDNGNGDGENGDGNGDNGDEPGPPSEGGELVDGNPDCEDLGYEHPGFKIDPAEEGTYDAGQGDSIELLTDGYYFDWSSSFGIEGVIGKATPSAVYWGYDELRFEDEEMHGPTGPESHPHAGEPYSIGHVIFCY